MEYSYVVDLRYLFDIFLGPSYNHSPPQVKYMTVGIMSYFLSL